MTRMVQCVKLGREAEGLASQTWPGDLGRRIFEEVSLEAWQEWLRQQTVLINEYRLNPLDARDKKYLAEQMEAYFFGDGIVMPDQWQPDDS
ncbi:MAG: oxidative damage protection protein [Gammaproteobacteria bacterium]|nr:oxidative damage protection protein [Gammaproteobacteria bacterium]MDE0280617.1 oxidative damage protection protein [Gammaproteobacteria bacterium]MDE0715139.1 oxidative damage protection protein [Gammaproteobacteria bacterium]MXX15836.1 oxidative damage protection protein [Gammaproteobacteria bacterium]MXY65020.1 oxidative damage protection protein [Gammaproteobacteria bacterium]